MKQKEFALRFGQVEPLLVAMHRVNDDKLTTLKGRWQHFQRIGFPPETKTGRGKAAFYGAPSIVKTLVILELAALRIPPEQSVELLADLDWSPAIDLFLHGLEGAPSETLLLAFDPDGLCILRGSRALTNAEWLSLPTDSERLEIRMGDSRVAIVNVGRVIGNALSALNKIGVQS